MKVIKNNYVANKEANIKEEAKYPKKIICENCNSELEYNESDKRVGEFGCIFVDCPCCGYDNLIYDEEFIITKDNVEFPLHFHHCSKENGAKDVCNNERVKEYINKAIKYFRENKDEFVWSSSTGNINVIVFRCTDDECYEVFVTNNYYDTFIQFEEEDY